jgi:hypothetical protein
MHKITFSVAIITLFVASAFGQGTFIYDQQSSTESDLGEEGFDIQFWQPLGQSFTPSLDRVGFIRMYLGRGSFNQGAAIFLNLRTDSITGAVLASTSPVTLPVGFIGTVDFFFTNEVPLTPGITYYFQPKIQSGGPFSVSGDTFRYPGGNAFLQGIASRGDDLWFREGIIVPEPSVTALLVLGSGAFVYARRKRIGSPAPVESRLL